MVTLTPEATAIIAERIEHQALAAGIPSAHLGLRVQVPEGTCSKSSVECLIDPVRDGDAVYPNGPVRALFTPQLPGSLDHLQLHFDGQAFELTFQAPD